MGQSTTVVRVVQIEDKVTVTAVRPLWVPAKPEISPPLYPLELLTPCRFTPLEDFPLIFVDTAGCCSLQKQLKTACSLAKLQLLFAAPAVTWKLAGRLICWELQLPNMLVFTH